MPRSAQSLLEPLRGLLGKVPDQQIADKAGVSRALVVNFRKKLGIPPYEGYKFGQEKAGGAAKEEDARVFRGRRSALDAWTHLLGTVPDAEVAKLANVTAENVRTYRHRRNIPAKWKDGAEEAVAAPAPVPVAAKAPEVVETRPAARPSASERALAPASAVTTVSTTAVVEPNAIAVTPEGTAFLVVVDTEQGTRNYALVANDIASAAGAAQARVSARHPNAAIRSIQRVAELLP